MKQENLWTSHTEAVKSSKRKRWILPKDFARSDALRRAKQKNTATARCEVCHLLFPLDYIRWKEATWITESQSYCKDHNPK